MANKVAQRRKANKPKISKDTRIFQTKRNKLAKMQRHLHKNPKDYTTEYAIQCLIFD